MPGLEPKAPVNRLTACLAKLTSQTPDGRMAAFGAGFAGAGGGKSGLHENTVPDNVRRGRPQGKCHRKQTAAFRGGKGERVR